MFKVALLATALWAVAPMSVAADSGIDLGTSQDGGASCRAGTAADPACAFRIVDADDDGTLSLAEVTTFTATTLGAQWAAATPARSSWAAFEDAAKGSAASLPTPVERDGRQRIVPALLALGALVVLLRRGPGSF